MRGQACYKTVWRKAQEETPVSRGWGEGCLQGQEEVYQTEQAESMLGGGATVGVSLVSAWRGCRWEEKVAGK